MEDLGGFAYFAYELYALELFFDVGCRFFVGELVADAAFADVNHGFATAVQRFEEGLFAAVRWLDEV